MLLDENAILLAFTLRLLRLSKFKVFLQNNGSAERARRPLFPRSPLTYVVQHGASQVYVGSMKRGPWQPSSTSVAATIPSLSSLRPGTQQHACDMRQGAPGTAESPQKQAALSGHLLLGAHRRSWESRGHWLESLGRRSFPRSHLGDKYWYARNRTTVPR